MLTQILFANILQWRIVTRMQPKAALDKELTARRDLFRLSKSKAIADVCVSTMREYNRQGLPFYRLGKSVFVSLSEFEHFVKTNASND